MEYFNTDDYAHHIRAYYDQRLSEYGGDVESLYWGSTWSQQIRFRALLKIGNLNHCSIQDIGCGFGDLYGLFQRLGIDAEYYGVDLNPNMIEIARERYPEANFSVANILDRDYYRHSDYIVGSGIFAEEQQPWIPFVEQMLHRMFEMADVAIGFNMQSAWGREYFPRGIPDHVNFAPVYWLEFCREHLSRRIVFLHDYLPYDFTIFVYKESSERGE